MWSISEREFNIMLTQPEASRYEYFVKRVADWQQVWSLKDEQGWVLYADEEGHEIVPVWPHPRFAEACAVHEWKTAAPSAIRIEDWLERWSPGLIRDHRLVAVFPIPSQRGIRVYPERLRDDIERELTKYE